MEPTISISDDAVDLMLMPLWFEMVSGLFFFGTILVIIIIAHIIVKKKGKGGYSLLISMYTTIIFTVAPVPFSFLFEADADFIPLLVWMTYIGSSAFMFLTAVHGLRFVLSVASNKTPLQKNEKEHT